ncbi:MAG TPA: hypothetical protein VNT54_14775 [Solirubrobacteraceae bacterium]|nr:hypothetical protein [Solirubrobacteraceae bacterium]
MLEPPAYVLSAEVSDMLLAAPSFGHVEVGNPLSAVRISPSKTIGGLTERQRDDLVRLLRR